MKSLMLKDGPGLNLSSLMIAHDTRCEARMRGRGIASPAGQKLFRSQPHRS